MDRAKMVITPTASRPYERVNLDTVGPLEESYEHKRYILSIEDDLSKFMQCVALSEVSAESVVRIFLLKRYYASMGS